jgi:hypothetical protein
MIQSVMGVSAQEGLNHEVVNKLRESQKRLNKVFLRRGGARALIQSSDDPTMEYVTEEDQRVEDFIDDYIQFMDEGRDTDRTAAPTTRWEARQAVWGGWRPTGNVAPIPRFASELNQGSLAKQGAAAVGIRTMADALAHQFVGPNWADDEYVEFFDDEEAVHRRRTKTRVRVQRTPFTEEGPRVDDEHIDFCKLMGIIEPGSCPRVDTCHTVMFAGSIAPKARFNWKDHIAHCNANFERLDALSNRSQPARTEESSVQGSGHLELLNVGSVVVDGRYHGSGYFVKGGGGIRFVTNLHGGDKVAENPRSIYEIYNVYKVLVGKGVVAGTQVSATSSDAWVLPVSKEGEESVVPVKSASVIPKVNDIVTIVSMASGQPKVTSGRVLNVSMNDFQTFSYGVTTYEGDCRSPIFNALGQLLGGHRWGGCNNTSNSGELDIGMSDKNRGVVNRVILGGLKPLAVEQGPKLANEDIDFLGSVTPPMGVNVENKYWHLVEMPGYVRDMIPLKHLVSKPGVGAVRDEIEKFVPFVVNDEILNKVGKAITAQMRMDSNTSFSYLHSTHPQARAKVEACLQLVKMSSKAGLVDWVAMNETTEAYLKRIGTDNFIDSVLELLSEFEQDEDMEHEFCFQVFAKQDKYSITKLEANAGRSIQAGDLMLKVIWLYCFRDSDVEWTTMSAEPSVDFEARFDTGVNPYHPVDHVRRSLYTRARGCFSTDATGWDRLLPAVVMWLVIYNYFAPLCPGIPKSLIRSIGRSLIDSVMLLPDGTLVRKHTGLPSGGANTLRFNCIANAAIAMVACAHALGIALGRIVLMSEVRNWVFQEFCGDDNRTWVLGDIPVHKFAEDYLHFWKTEMPWVIKLEGLKDWGDKGCPADQWPLAPTFVGRRLALFDGFLLTPLAESHRCASKLLCAEKGVEKSKFEERLSGVSLALCLNVVLHHSRHIFDPTIVALEQFYPEWFNVRRATNQATFLSLQE